MEQFKTRGDDVGCVSAWGSGGLRTEFYRFVRATGRGLKGLFPAGATRRPRSRALKAIEHGNEPDRRTARSDAERFAIELATLKVPVAPQIICKSPTAARLVQLLAEQYGRLALMAGEVDLATLLGVGGGRGSAPTDSAILDSFDGSDVTEERMRREDGLGGDRIVARAHLSMGIAIQPSRLASLLKRNPDLLHNGFFARGLYVVPADLSESRTYQPHAMPAAARDAYREGLRRLLDLPWPEASAIQSMTLSPGAESVYMDLQRGELKRRMSKTGDMHSGPLRTWAERAHAQALGLAGVLHLAENAPHHFATTVSRETMERAASDGRLLHPDCGGRARIHPELEGAK